MYNYKGNNRTEKLYDYICYNYTQFIRIFSNFL